MPLKGRHFSGKDLGVSINDVAYLQKICNYVAVTEKESPGVYTAYGVYQGMLAGLNHALGKATLKGVKVAVQGVGEVGTYLVDLLLKQGAKVVVSDVHPEPLKRLLKAYPKVRMVPPEEILFQDCDVFSPCALGGVLRAEDVDAYKFKIVAGGANNQLESPAVAKMLEQRKITYLPDYVINAGGLIAVGAFGQKSKQAIQRQVDDIPARIKMILDRSQRHGITTDAAALNMAKQRLAGRESAFTPVQPKSPPLPLPMPLQNFSAYHGTDMTLT